MVDATGLSPNRFPVVVALKSVTHGKSAEAALVITTIIEAQIQFDNRETHDGNYRVPQQGLTHPVLSTCVTNSTCGGTAVAMASGPQI